MTRDQVKSFFAEIRDEQSEIEHLDEMERTLNYSIKGTKGIRYDIDKVQTSPSDKMPEVIAKLDEMRSTLAAKKIALADRRIKAEKLVEQLKRSKEREVMRLYYIDSIGQRNTWDLVSMCVGLERRQVTRIHNAALDNIAEIIDKGA